MAYQQGLIFSIFLASAGCSQVPVNNSFLMPDGRKAAVVSVSGNGVTPPIVAVITPRRSPYNVQVFAAQPPVQSALQGAVGGIAIGAGLAGQGALLRPSRVNANASNIGGSASGGNAAGGTATGGSVTNCVTGPC